MIGELKVKVVEKKMIHWRHKQFVTQIYIHESITFYSRVISNGSKL
jgi:hypothetical protein